MTESENNVVIAQLRAIRATLDGMEKGIARVHVEIAALGQQVGGLTTAVYSSHERFEDIERRLDRIEARLELGDG